MAQIFTYPDNRAYFRFAQDPVNKDYAVYLSDPDMKLTYQVVGRARDPKGVTAVVNACIRKHLCTDGSLPATVVHG